MPTGLFGTWMPLAAMVLATAVTFAAPAVKTPGPNEPSPQTRTFFIAGIKTDAQVQAITEAVMKVKSVSKIGQLTPSSGYANISFDHHAVTHQQIAQAILATGGFQVSFRFVIPDYAANAEKVDAIFAKVKDEVQVETMSKEKGEFTLRFLPLKAGTPGPHGIGFNLGKIGHPLMDPAPKGLGLKVISISKGVAQSRTGRKSAAKSTAGQ